MLNWSKQFSIFSFLDNCGYTVQPHRWECLMACGATEAFEGVPMQDLDQFVGKNRWVFGHLSYELKTILHGIATAKKDKVGFPLYYFFVPEVVLTLKGSELAVYAPDPRAVYQEILSQELTVGEETASVNVQPRCTREQYTSIIEKLKEHIHRGDCYEINFCQEFYAEQARLDPFSAFQRLLEVSPNPFSALYRLQDRYLLCASPERFLYKDGDRILSQPIKGTIKRDVTDAAADERLKAALRNSKKEQAENVMVVDLVRNDLSVVCQRASVGVEELFGIYTFPQVHQMISTISGTLRKDTPFSQVLTALFPMGSMTGAPKRRVMELIERYEPSARGIFSGSVGYITPDGDFDFNVVIRSIMYNASSHYLSYQVGSGITWYCDPEKEWQECQLKAEGIKKVLAQRPAPVQ